MMGKKSDRKNVIDGTAQKLGNARVAQEGRWSRCNGANREGRKDSDVVPAR